MIRLWLQLVLMVCSAPALAESYFLELSEHESKAAAETQLVSWGPQSEGMRISRRYVRGSGWRYVIRYDGFTDREKAISTAAGLVRDGNVITVYEGVGYKRTVIERVGGAVEPQSTIAAAPAIASGIPSAIQILRDAVRAHGGRGGGARLLNKSNSLKFGFLSRTVVAEKEWKIRHQLYRDGDRARLEVDMLKGDGVSNTVVVGGDGKAWVATHDLVRERDLAQAAEMMARFAPETGLLSIPLGLAADIKEASEWQGLKTSGRVSYRGVPHYRVVPDRKGDGEMNPLEAALFQEETGLLVQLTWVTRGGRVTFTYDDYRAVIDDLLIPHSIRIERNGGLVEAVEITEFSVNATLPESLFSEPTKIKGRRH